MGISVSTTVILKINLNFIKYGSNQRHQIIYENRSSIFGIFHGRNYGRLLRFWDFIGLSRYRFFEKREKLLKSFPEKSQRKRIGQRNKNQRF